MGKKPINLKERDGGGGARKETPVKMDALDRKHQTRGTALVLRFQ